MANKPEYYVAMAVSQYLKIQYPNVIFRFDQAGYNLSIAQAGMNKAIQMREFKYPDLFIAKPNKEFAGLFIELKAEGQKLYKKDGYTFVSEHLEGQAMALHYLLKAGYDAYFAIGFDQAKSIIDNYMKID